MPTKAEKLAEAKRSVRAEAKKKVAARKAATGGRSKPAEKKPTPSRTRGITNIIKRRAGQANRVVARALQGK